MSTYGQIQDRINLDYLNRTDLASETKRAIQAAIRYYERKRWWFNETSTALATVASQAFVTLPTDLIALDLVQLTVNSNDLELTRRDHNWIREANTARTTGQPTDYAIYKNRIELFPIANSAYDLPVYYIHALTTLSADTDTNFWTSGGAEDCIVYRATAFMLATTMGVPDKAATFFTLERQAYTEVQATHEQKRNNILKATRF